MDTLDLILSIFHFTVGIGAVVVATNWDRLGTLLHGKPKESHLVLRRLYLVSGIAMIILGIILFVLTTYAPME